MAGIYDLDTTLDAAPPDLGELMVDALTAYGAESVAVSVTESAPGVEVGATFFAPSEAAATSMFRRALSVAAPGSSRSGGLRRAFGSTSCGDDSCG